MMLMILMLLWICISPRLAAAQSLKEIRIGSSDITVSNLCTFYARDRKFFEAEGIDVKIIIVKTEVTLAALRAGDLEYSTLSTSSIEAALKGMPLRLIAVTNRNPLLGLVVRKGINSVSDLRGKKISVSSFGGAVYGAAALYAQESRAQAKGGRGDPGGRLQRSARRRAATGSGGCRAVEFTGRHPGCRGGLPYSA